MKVQGFELGSIGTNCYVVSDDNGTCAIIDCDGNGEKLFQYIEENKLNPTHILLTHGHSDHIGAVTAVKEKFGCQICAYKDEAAMLEDPKLNLSGSMFGKGISFHADVLLSDKETIQVGEISFEVMYTPGHTSGSVCFITDKIIFSGDTLFLGSCGRTDFPTGDWGTIVNSLKLLKELSGDYVVYPGHGPATTLDYERRTNPYM